MLIELRPLKRKDSGPMIATIMGTLGQVVADYQQNPAYQDLLRTAHVSFDWVQYKNNFRLAITERPAYDPDCQDIHRRELVIDLRQVDVDNFTTQLRQLLDSWIPAGSPPHAEISYPATDNTGRSDSAVALATRTVMTAVPAVVTRRIYLEPFQPARNSIIWSFNTLYWNALDKWEATFQRSYEAALPGGVTDACNPDFVAETVKRLCQ